MDINTCVKNYAQKLGKTSFILKSIAKRPNKIQPTVESKSGQVSNQFLVEYVDIQLKIILICDKFDARIMKDYKKRVADQILLDKLESSGAVWKFRSKVVPSFSCKWGPLFRCKVSPWS